MDSTDIPSHVFASICTQFDNKVVDPSKCNKEIVQQIIDWNDTLDPSFNIVKSQFRKFMLQKQNNAQAMCTDVLKSLDLLTEFKCPRNFLRGYLATIKSILEGQQCPAKTLLQQKLAQYEKSWLSINPQVLQTYFDAFSLKNKVTQSQIDQFIQSMINTKKYNNCMDFIKFLGVGQNKQNIDKLMAKMSNKRDASKAADYVKRLKLDPKNYPALGQRLYKNTARHFLTKHGWQYAEQVFEQYPQALACVVEDLIYKKKFAQARSIWSRHPLWDHLQKQQSREYLKQQYKQQLIPNHIMCNDVFGPPNKQKFISLSDFGIEEHDVIWVDQSTANLDQILNDLQSAQMLGIDTESIVGQTKFQKVDQAAVIQVSTGKKIYLFDGFKSNSNKIATAFQACFDNLKIVGHSFTNDTQGIMKGFGLKTGGQVRIKNMIDICKVYKGLNQNAKYSSLAHICKQTFKKQLCKDQTLTNWRRRPLRKNQIHYAALDAHIVLEVYTAWLKEYGQIVHYHAAMDNDQI